MMEYQVAETIRYLAEEGGGNINLLYLLIIPAVAGLGWLARVFSQAHGEGTERYKQKERWRTFCDPEA